MREKALVALVGLGVVSAVLGEREARACGGCIPPPAEIESVITDEKMILSISKDQTTLYDEIEYSGAPSSFAWVLPIKGTVTVGLSADIMFSTLESATTTEVLQPTPECPVSSCANLQYPGASGGGSGGSGGGKNGGGGVTVLSQKQVGPYETVQLKSNDGSALENWLASHGYKLPPADKPVVEAYVAEHFDFLALKLVPGAGVKTMQPVRVTSKGASISLPLHMVAVGTGPTTGITIWVVADGRWEPQNFPTFTIRESELSWDWTTSSSNYETLRLSKEASFGGKGWQIESSLELSQTGFQNNLVDAILYGGTQDGLYTVSGATGGGDAGSGADAGDGSTADAGAAQELAAMQDLGVLFAGIHGPNVRITRMRSDVAHSALSNDMFLKAAADQSELANTLTPAHQIGQPPCPVCYSGSGSGSGGSGGQSGLAGNGGSGAGAGPADSSAGCNTTGSVEDSSTTVAGLFAMAGLVVLRLRRRRSASR
jgi:MYXO-CTERM domain-containing protein